MAVGDLVTTDYTFEWNGLLFGGSSGYDIVSVEGLADLPSLETSDQKLVRRDGLILGDDFLAGREIVLELEITGSNISTLVDSLRDSTNKGTDAIFVFQLPGVADGSKVQVSARIRKRQIKVDNEYQIGFVRASVMFVCGDPRFTSNTLQSETSLLPSVGGGLEFPVTGDLIFSGVATGGAIYATNNGAYPAKWVARIDGPCVNPRILNVTDDVEIGLTINIASGDYLEIDTTNNTVLLNGLVSYYHTITSISEWFDLNPGTTELQFRASTDTAAELTIEWRDTWI